MNLHFSQIALLAITSVLAPAATASSGSTFVGGEAGYATHSMPNTTARQQVLDALVLWHRNPVTADGWMEVHGDAAWVYIGTPDTKTRRQVIDELAQWRRNPLTSDGWMEQGGDAGWVYVGNRRPEAKQLTAKTR